MSILHNKDFWLGTGISLAVLVGLNLIARQVHNGVRADQQETESLRDNRLRLQQKYETSRVKLSRTKSPQEARTDEDISIDALETLVYHPNYEIRQAAIKILVHRYAAHPYCKRSFSAEYAKLSDDELEDSSFSQPVLRVQSLMWSYDVDLPTHRDSVSRDEEQLADWMGLLPQGHSDLQGRLEALDGIENMMERVGLDAVPRESTPARRPLSQWQRREAIVVDRDDNEERPELVVPEELPAESIEFDEPHLDSDQQFTF